MTGRRRCGTCSGRCSTPRISRSTIEGRAMFDVKMGRRDFLRVGALGGLSLAGALAANESRKSRAKSVLLVYLGGGLSHHDSFDPKPDAPAEVRGKYSTINTSVPGLRVTEMVPRMAKVMHKVG